MLDMRFLSLTVEVVDEVQADGIPRFHLRRGPLLKALHSQQA